MNLFPPKPAGRVQAATLAPFLGEDYVAQGVASSCEGDQTCDREFLYISSYWRNIEDQDAEDRADFDRASVISEIVPGTDERPYEHRRCFRLNGLLGNSHVGGIAYYAGALYVSSNPNRSDDPEGLNHPYIERYELPGLDESRLYPQRTADCDPIIPSGRWKTMASSFVSFVTLDGAPSLLVGRYCKNSSKCKYPDGEAAKPYAYQYWLDAQSGDLLTFDLDPTQIQASTDIPPAFAQACDPFESDADDGVDWTVDEALVTPRRSWCRKFRIPYQSQGVDVQHTPNSDMMLVSQSGGDIKLKQYMLDELYCPRGASCSIPKTQDTLSLVTRLQFAAGAEDLALSRGRLWSVSESGARFFQIVKKWKDYYPWVYYTVPVYYGWEKVAGTPGAGRTERSYFADIVTNALEAYAGWWNNTDRIRLMDVTGNGQSDVVIGPKKSSGKWFVITSHTDGALIDAGEWTSGEFAGWWDDAERIYPVDVNDDGMEDIVVGPRSTGEWYVMTSNGAGFDESDVVLEAYGGWYDNTDRIRWMDFDGDGDKDVVIGPRSTGEWYLIENALTGDGEPNLIDRGVIANGYEGWYDDPERIWVADVNCDDRDDIVIGPRSTGEWYALTSQGTGANSSLEDHGVVLNKYENWYKHADRIRVMDLDGNGCDDFLIGPRSDGAWFAITSTDPNPGSETKEDVLLDLGVANRRRWVDEFGLGYKNWHNDEPRIRVLDVNGDRCDDVLIGPKKGTGEWNVLQSDGEKFVVSRQLAVDTLDGWWNDTERIWIGETNGDGYDDVLIGPKKSSGRWSVLRPTVIGEDWIDCRQ